jgi:hypothetical protein
VNERQTYPRRLIAFYLPQFHPIAENDEWWGRGFTEWTNVTRARPAFRGHYQPHLPRDLGFYDLRVPEVRCAQTELAAAYGIFGFCYYHYWFGGRRLLERPFNEVLESGIPDFPFCLCWANEDWNRSWAGFGHHIVLAQSYSADDDRSHIRSLCPAFMDKRYIRVDGKPLFLVYKACSLPDAHHTTDIWREECVRLGVGELCLAKVDNPREEGVDPRAGGFDVAVEFQPAWDDLGSPIGRGRWRSILRRVGGAAADSAFFRHHVFEYRAVVERMLARTPPYPRFPCVTPMWDNHARHRAAGAWILHGSTPELYERWLRLTVERFEPPAPDRNLVFINGWNEWAEGNHLEPDERWGLAYLEATKRAGAGLVEYAPPPQR